MGLQGPSKTITVEPVQEPASTPREEPAPPAKVPDKEPVPA